MSVYTITIAQAEGDEYERVTVEGTKDTMRTVLLALLEQTMAVLAGHDGAAGPDLRRELTAAFDAVPAATDGTTIAIGAWEHRVSERTTMPSAL